MPELPEVEITRRGIEPYLVGKTITRVVTRQHALRWPVPPHLASSLPGLAILAVRRRAKYIVLDCGTGALIVHLGMSGSLRVVPSGAAPGPYDHFDLQLGARAIRLRDPRRFGAVLWQDGRAEDHPLLANLGVEPLSKAFTPAVLFAATRGRTLAIKQLLMNHGVVVGIGNIYASESLFDARINPKTRAGRLSLARCAALTGAVRRILTRAVAAGGSTLRDYAHADGEPGYFQQQYTVYGRAGEPCRVCGAPIRRLIQGQRSTYYCAHCQK